MDIRPRAYRVKTYDESTFFVRFHPTEIKFEVLCGSMFLIGYSKKIERKVEWNGVGAIPMVGGRIVVSPEPVGFETVEGEKFPIYITEIISQVKEIPVPDDLIDSS